MPTKEQKAELYQIMVDHDVMRFREFIRKTQDPQLVAFVEDADTVLSNLLHAAKTNAMYLGPIWQESRNHLRKIANWSHDMSKWPAVVRSMFEASGQLPSCITCKFFREAPKGESPCMHMGATPADVCCDAYTPLEQN